MVRITNQIVCVCGWLVNFQPVLIPPPPVTEDNDDEVDQYFDTCYTTDADYDADSENSDDTCNTYIISLYKTNILVQMQYTVIQ